MEPFVALLGVGYWGKNILRNLHELGLLKTVYDTDEKVLDERISRYPRAKKASSLDEILRDPAIKAVCIATPAATHYSIAKEAIQAGKDVYVEKPLALTVREGEELVALADEYERILMVGHILQYHPAVLKLKGLIAGGELGKIQHIYSNRLNIGKLRTEENILWSFAPHDISAILMLVGEEPTLVRAFGGDYLNRGIYDTTLTVLEFGNGIKGHIFVSWLHPFKEQKLVVVGTRAMAVFDDVSEEKLFIYPHQIRWKEGKIPIAEKAPRYVVEVEKREPLKEELMHFAQCVLERRMPRTDGREGIRVLRILEMAEKSLKSRGAAAESSWMRKESDFFVHESSYIDSGVEIGAGTKIWHYCHILGGSRIGRGCTIGQNVMIGPDVTIGDRCKIQNNVSVYKGVTLEDDVFVGPSAVFTNVYNPRAFIERKHEFTPTFVKKGATIGANATVVCGCTIGEYAFVAAGAVVTSDIPDHALVVGVPAKQKGWVCNCGTTLEAANELLKCGYCGRTYRLKGGRLTEA